MSSAIGRTALAVVLACAVASADSLSVEVREPARPRLQVYVAEFGVGLGVFAIAAPLGYAVSYGAVYVTTMCLLGPLFMGMTGPEALLSFAAGLVAAPFEATVAAVPGFCAEAVFRVGQRLGEDGARFPTVVGAYVGALPGAGIAWGGLALAQEKRNDWLGVPFYVLGAACVPLGAMIGYNLSIPKESESDGLGQRLRPPGITFTSVEHLDHSVEYGVKVQLAGLRF